MMMIKLDNLPPIFIDLACEFWYIRLDCFSPNIFATICSSTNKLGLNLNNFISTLLRVLSTGILSTIVNNFVDNNFFPTYWQGTHWWQYTKLEKHWEKNQRNARRIPMIIIIIWKRYLRCNTDLVTHGHSRYII